MDMKQTAEGVEKYLNLNTKEEYFSRLVHQEIAEWGIKK
jgi:hypothetical protein